MRVVFLYMGAENLGVQYLSSVLKKHGHETFMVFDPALFNDKYWLTVNSLSKFFDQKKEVIDKVVDLKPDFPSMEKKVLSEWYSEGIVQKYLKKNSNSQNYFFNNFLFLVKKLA